MSVAESIPIARRQTVVEAIAQALIDSGLIKENSAVGSFLKEQLSHAHVLIYGILLVVVILYMPDGILGFVKKIGARKRKGAV